MKKIVLILVSLVAFIFIGCGGDSGGDSESTTPTVETPAVETPNEVDVDTGSLPSIPQIPVDE